MSESEEVNVPTVFLKDGKIVDMTFTAWIDDGIGLGDHGELYHSFHVAGDNIITIEHDFDAVVFEMPHGCFILRDLFGIKGNTLPFSASGGQRGRLEACDTPREWSQSQSHDDMRREDVDTAIQRDPGRISA